MISADARGGQGWPLSGFEYKDCDALQANEIHHTVTWNGESNVAALEGKVVKLKFQLRPARLFSFGFVD